MAERPRKSFTFRVCLYSVVPIFFSRFIERISVFLNGTVAVSGRGSNVVLSSSNISAGFSSAFTEAADQTLTISGATQVNIGSNFQQFSGMNRTVAVASGANLRFSN